MSTMPIEPPEHDPLNEYIPDPFGRVGMGTRRRRKSSRALDAAIDGIRRIIEAGKPMEAAFGSSPYQLDAPVGRRGANDRIDVAKIETLLGRAGYLDLAPTDGPTGYYGARLENALKRFQKDDGLKADGLVNPDGPTLAALTRATAANDNGNSPEAPSLLESDSARIEPRRLTDEPVQEQQHAAMLLDGLGRKVVMPPQHTLPGQPMAPIPLSPRYVLPGRRTIPIPLPPLPLPPGPAESAKDRVPRKPPIVGQDRSTGHTPPTPANDNDQKPILPSPSPTDAFLEELLRPYRENRRGGEFTQYGNDVIVQEGRKILEAEFPDLKDHIDHAGGASVDGLGKHKIEETYLKNVETNGKKGSSYPDIYYKHKTLPKEDRRRHGALNTVDMNKSGNPTKRERDNKDKLIRNMESDLVETLPKFRPGDDEPAFREASRLKLRDFFSQWQKLLSTP